MTSKAITQGRTNHCSNISTNRKFSAGCYLLTVSNRACLSVMGSDWFSQFHFYFHFSSCDC